MQVGALGVNLPAYRRQTKPKAMSAAEVNRQLVLMQRRGVNVNLTGPASE